MALSDSRPPRLNASSVVAEWMLGEKSMRRNNALDHERRVGARPTVIISTPDAILSLPERVEAFALAMPPKSKTIQMAGSQGFAERWGRPAER